MKKVIIAVVAFYLLLACTPEEKAVLVTGISLDVTAVTIFEGETVTLVPSVTPDNATDKSVTWSSTDNSVATVDANGKVTAVSGGSATIRASAKDGSLKYAECAVKVKVPCPPGAVDLGLSVYWASCNLSEDGFVKSPEQFGDYYAWGELEPKSEYNWSTYKWCNGSYNSLTKYDSWKEALDESDDAAHVKLGDRWRIPSDNNWTELKLNCEWRLTTQNGVYGILVTGSNGNSIFFPSAGYRHNTDYYEVGSEGYYWSSTRSKDIDYAAWNLLFNSDDVLVDYMERDLGALVRPVYY